MPVAGRFKAYFLRGLAALLPTVLTIWIFVWGYSFIQQYLGEYIKTGIRQIIVMAGGAEAELDKFWINHALSVASFARMKLNPGRPWMHLLAEETR